MYNKFVIKPPFFEFGPKAYLYGEELLSLAQEIDRYAIKYDLDVILTPQYTDISLLAKNTERIFIFAQHMDYLPVGRGLGSVLPEAVRAAGASGVMLNHAEKPLSMDAIAKTIARADEVGLATIVCADNAEELSQIAAMHPNLVVAEPTKLIGTGITSDEEYVKSTIEAVQAVDPRIMVLQGAGISNENDVYKTIQLGAMATGSTSGIIKAKNPADMAGRMLKALRESWDELHKNKQ